ncbi:hypothetical protein HanRHA438_Chr08g0368481 [Helianthus annuus]|nr:hypothetical protein HanIR_Chr08g0384621 [Helianthus annuus]KAJ0899426.1 hypothetical protein HanRHA438_Chr08g0368481 [Helianthus annuus]
MLNRNILSRYLHRLICTSITTRGKSREWCTSTNLFFLCCLLYACTRGHALLHTVWHSTSALPPHR